MPYDVFISYSSLDKTAADAACAALESNGIRCWIAPRDVTPGAEWGEAIILAINQCRVMVLVFSANANNSPQIRREVERAVSKGLPIIPLRIENIVPARSLEYFIGDVHWLDALTPPLETHLQRLAETIKALLQVGATTTAAASNSASIATPPVAMPRKSGIAALAIAGACILAAAGGISAWWFNGAHTPPPASPPQPTASNPPVPTAPAVPVTPSAPAINAAADPAMVGIFELDTVNDDYNWRFVFTIAANATYDMVTTWGETGTFQTGGGSYRTVASKTGRVRQGTYRAVDSTSIAVTSATGTAVFRAAQQAAPVDLANPAMLGVWTSTVIQGGVKWTLTLQNNADGTYSYQARAEDNGTCAFANQQWHTTSVVNGQVTAGTYRVVDAHSVELSSPQGTAVWRRQ
jgi:hypothetical protein